MLEQQLMSEYNLITLGFEPTCGLNIQFHNKKRLGISRIIFRNKKRRGISSIIFIIEDGFLASITIRHSRGKSLSVLPRPICFYEGLVMMEHDGALGYYRKEKIKKVC